MPEPIISNVTSPVSTEDQAIRERVRGLTNQALQQGRIDPEAVRDIVRAVIVGTSGNMAISIAEARKLLPDAISKIDDALVHSASATHAAIQKLVARGKDFIDNDLKEA